MVKKISLYIKLLRLHQPTGILLLLFPCLWGLASSTNSFDKNFFKLVAIFSVGSFLMRSAGCIINDIVDRKIDAKVERTKNRPLASGAVSVKEAMFILFILVSTGLFLLFQLNKTAIYIGLLSSILVVTYPFMKRITFWPQAFLGLTFNIGVLVAWAAVQNTVAPAAIVLYLAGVFWTLGYDTIYAHQDKEDDIKAGVKSTALWLGSKTKPYLYYFYSLTIIMILVHGFIQKLSINFYYAAGFSALLLFWQVFALDIRNPKDCMKKFKQSSLFGAIILIAIILGKI